MMKRWLMVLCCACAGLAAPALNAASSGPPQPSASTYARRMQWFADAKFGIFIHWGIYSVDGITESWSFFDGDIPYADYMKQLKGFTASHYDPQAWADLIKASGAKYAVLTSKHHDGVALWPTQRGLNVVKDTPAHRDLVGPFVKALRKDDLKVGLYFSLIDWSSPLYPAFIQGHPRYDIKDDPARWQRFVTYYQDQVHDLTRRYHPDLYWFDGDWEHSAAQWHAKALHDWIMAHNPDAIINGRLPGYGDYGTPEQGVPIARPPYKYWELCLTMNNSWGATPKHFAVHSGPEPGRHGFDVDVSPHDLEATYLPAFRAAVTEGRAGSVMCAYNALHGTPVCADAWLLTTLLRKGWGFKGYVVSDCDAVDDMTRFHYYKPDDAQSSAAAIAAGTDLDCGNAYASLGEAVRKGYVKESVLDTALVRLFAARYRLGTLGGDRDDPYSHIGIDQIDSAAHRALALKAALESIVLLKNAHATLPLKPGTRIAVVGPDADTVETLEASYHGTARDPITPLQGLRKRFGADRVSYAQGASIVASVPIPIPATALRSGGKPGLKGEYFANLDFSGTPRVTRVDRTIDFDWDHVAPGGNLDPDRYAVRWTGELVPPGAGDYTLVVHVDRCFDCRGHDPVRLFLDGKKIIDDNGSGKHMRANVHFADASPHSIRLEMVHSGQDQGVRLQWVAPAAAQLAQAEAAVKHADVIVAFVGLSPDVEGEELPIDVPGFDHGDRTDIALPAVQRTLLQTMAASGKPLVVVLMSGGAVGLDWAEQHADAILAAWYPGQSGGTAIAQVLAGDYAPAGRLPVTFYRSTRDLPPYVSYSMHGRTYRYFKGAPLYPFGYGLSYTTFAYADPRLSTTRLQAGGTLSVSAVVRNAGKRAGDEVVQAYLEYPDLPLSPQHALVGFRRVHLAPGASRRIDFELSPRRLSSVDAAGVRSVEPGSYRIFVGGGQPGDAPGVSASFTITGRDVLPR